MHKRPLRRGGRSQHYYVSPVRYTLSAGGDDPELWAARLAGFLYIVAGTVLAAILLLPLLGAAGDLILMLFMPVWGLLGLVTVIPSRAEPWVWSGLAAAFYAVGIGILRGWRIAHFAGMALALTLFVPAVWAGSLVGGFLLIALWRGQKALTGVAGQPGAAPSST